MVRLPPCPPPPSREASIEEEERDAIPPRNVRGETNWGGYDGQPQTGLNVADRQGRPAAAVPHRSL